MYFVKRYKNLILSVIITFYTFMLNLSIFYFSDIYLSLDNYNIKPTNTMVNIPRPLHLEILSINALIPEEEIISISETIKAQFSLSFRYLYNTNHPSLFSISKVKMFVYKLMTTINRRQNTSISNAIPLGGHAPPMFYI